MPTTINERFKEVRKMLKLNQEQFAREVGVSRAHVSNIENGNDNPSAALIKLICMKFNIDEPWLIDGVGSPTPDWDVRTDEGAISKYNAMRVSFEEKLRSRTGEDLTNTVEAFAYFDALLSPRKLSDEDKSKYLSSVSMAVDEYEKIIFAVSSSILPSKKDAAACLRFKSECESRLNSIFANIKDSVNLYMALIGEEMKL